MSQDATSTFNVGIHVHPAILPVLLSLPQLQVMAVHQVAPQEAQPLQLVRLEAGGKALSKLGKPRGRRGRMATKCVRGEVRGLNQA